MIGPKGRGIAVRYDKIGDMFVVNGSFFPRVVPELLPCDGHIEELYQDERGRIWDNYCANNEDILLSGQCFDSADAMFLRGELDGALNGV